MARKRKQPERSGFLIIDKPAGWTSHDVVGKVRRIVGERQVGHTGTLDPAATGVLPVAVGHATRLLPFLDDADKTYIATVRFGISTDSGDRDGRLLDRRSTDHLTEQRVGTALGAFQGMIEQVPPMHSAIKVGGRKLYDVARSGDEIDVPVRTVSVHEIELLEWRPPEAVIHVRCSAGTYIRSIARDLGEAVGSGAMLARLVRTQAGPARIDAAIAITQLERRLERWGWSTIALHPDAWLAHTPVAILRLDEEARWFNGLPIDRQVSAPIVRVYDSRREWVGVGVADADVPGIHPKRVIRGSSERP